MRNVSLTTNDHERIELVHHEGGFKKALSGHGFLMPRMRFVQRDRQGSGFSL